MVGRRLQHDPGSTEKYSNFGHCVLGRLIEKVSKKKYADFIREDLLAPLGITSIRLGHSLPEDRNPAEPVYVSLEAGPNVVNPQRPPGPLCDGGFYLEAMDAHGGLIGSATDLVRFANSFKINGEPYTGSPGAARHDGSLPGTSSFLQWREDRVLIAAIFNLRHAPNSDEIAGSLNAAADSIIKWP
jgi:N-acyl-D-amino-acid deacylase